MGQSVPEWTSEGGARTAVRSPSSRGFALMWFAGAARLDLSKRGSLESCGEVDHQEAQHTPLYVALIDALRARGATRVLDAGCGAGLAAKIAADQGLAVSAFDAAPALVEIARERLPGPEVLWAEHDRSDHYPNLDVAMTAQLSAGALVRAEQAVGAGIMHATLEDVLLDHRQPTARCLRERLSVRHRSQARLASPPPEDGVAAFSRSG